MYHVRIAPGGIRTRDNLLGRQEPLTTRRLMHEIEKEPGGGLEPLQPSLASTRWRMGHPPIVRMIPEILLLLDSDQFFLSQSQAYYQLY